MNSPDSQKINAGSLFIFSALIFFVVSIVWGIILLFNLLPEKLPFGGADQLKTVFPGLLVQAFLFAGLGISARIIPGLRRFASNNQVLNILLLILVLYLPISILEITLAPFVGDDKPTSIFTHDMKRIWKLKPNAEDYWGGQIVKINNKGLRGREVEYGKPEGVIRILYLGDSVTFGYRLINDEDCFPDKTEPILEENLGCEIETVNAGIGGYSPWQEHLYLIEEGVKYNPDAVVLILVLNDFTQKFMLTRFGGFWEGYQLAMNSTYLMGRLSAHSNIMSFIKKKILERRFGFDPVLRAEDNEFTTTSDFLYQPDSKQVQLAEKTTLENLEKLLIDCREMNLPLLAVFFPPRFQLENMDASHRPQEILGDFFTKMDTPFLDLHPGIAKRMNSSGLKPEHLYLDDIHPTSLGNTIAAEEIAQALMKHELIAP
ncbi:MAG: SGNH/GDSL hydrolase family protein [Candidatus Electryonea clarkiae]|nr:SGNH/GDSL hydrolase family protein [Candidatus Electryonea clarkiae]